MTIVTQGRLSSVDQFKNIIVKTNKQGGAVRVGDIATVQLGAQTYTFNSKINQYPSATLAIYQAPAANSLRAGECHSPADEADLKELPPGVEIRDRL